MKSANRKLTQIHNARTLDDPATGWSACREIEKDNTAYESMTNGESAFAGATAMSMTSRSFDYH